MPERRHGTHARYSMDGCRCFPCRKAHYEYNQHRERQIAYGRWEKFVPAEPVRAHVNLLTNAGIGQRRIARLACVSLGTITRLLYGEKGKTAPSKRVRVEAARRIMSVQVSLDVIGHTTPVDATGTRRRLQALIACGWSRAKLAALAGIDPTNISRVLTTEKVWAAKARTVRDLYEQLWNVAPPEDDWRDKIAANRSRAYAAERGWAPPMAWDDETIDDPAAEPEGVGISKRNGKLPDDEEIAFLLEGGDSIETLADRYGAKVEAVKQRLLRAGKVAA